MQTKKMTESISIKCYLLRAIISQIMTKKIICVEKKTNGHRYMRNIEYFCVIRPDVFWYYT